MRLQSLIRNLSIKWKFALILAILLAVIGNTVTIYTAYSLQRSLKKEFFMKAEVLGKTVAETIAEPVLLSDVITVDEIMRDCSKRPWVSYCAVRDKDGKIIAHSFDGPPPADLLRSREATFINSSLYGELWEIAFQILEGEGGTLFIGLPWSPVRKTITGYVRNSIIIGLLFSIGVIGLSYIIARRFVTPITGLTGMTRKVAMRKTSEILPIEGPPCWEIMKCEKSDCPSFGNRIIPCWLRSGTLCLGETVGEFAKKFEDCRQCPVYKEHHGDEISELIFNFNLMSLTLKEQEEDTRKHIKEIEGLNQDLTKSYVKLSTLLDASRLTTSTLELEAILERSLSVILGVSKLNVGIVFLIDLNVMPKCWEYFECKEYNCPAHHDTLDCWRIMGSLCHGTHRDCPFHSSSIACWRERNIHSHGIPQKSYEDKLTACTDCEFFSNIVLIPKVTHGIQKLSASMGSFENCRNALLTGKSILSREIEPKKIDSAKITAEIAVPLGFREQIVGVLYLGSEEPLYNFGTEEMDFLSRLADVISMAIFNGMLFQQMEESYFSTISALTNAIEAKDPYIRGHTERVMGYTMKIADRLGLSIQEKDHLRFAAALHDIGKIGLSPSILDKPGILNEEEWAEIRRHPLKGIDILSPIKFLIPIIPHILHHHERYEGSGYPNGLEGNRIPLYARILAVVDAFDAMTSDRPYRKALDIEAAKKELRKEAGSQFDPEIVEIFLKILEEG